MLIIVEKDSAQSNDSKRKCTPKRSDTLPSDRYFNIHLHITVYFFSRPSRYRFNLDILQFGYPNNHLVIQIRSARSLSLGNVFQ